MAQLDAMKGAKFYIAIVTGTTPDDAPSDLNQSAYEALSWLQVNGVGSVGEMGTTDNIINYDTLDETVTQKQKGIANAGDPPIEVRRIPDDNGQIAMRTAAATNDYYAFKLEYADMESGGSTNTIVYNRGLVSGPMHPNGRNEDFILERYTLGLVQTEIVVNRT